MACHPLFGLQITNIQLAADMQDFFSSDISTNVAVQPSGDPLSIGGLAVQRHRDDREVPEALELPLGSRILPPLPSALLFRPKNCWRSSNTSRSLTSSACFLHHTARPGPWFYLMPWGPVIPQCMLADTCPSPRITYRPKGTCCCSATEVLHLGEPSGN